MILAIPKRGRSWEVYISMSVHDFLSYFHCNVSTIFSKSKSVNEKCCSSQKVIFRLALFKWLGLETLTNPKWVGLYIKNRIWRMKKCICWNIILPLHEKSKHQIWWWFHDERTDTVDGYNLKVAMESLFL